MVFVLVQKLKEIKLVGPDGKMTNRQRVISKALWLLSTARNALAVITCSFIAYYFHSYGYTPFVLTGKEINYN